MAERTFVEEVKKLRLGEGDTFQGEGILAVTKALLQSGVAYVGGYQGAPISHLMDVLADAQPILEELGIHFENNASEAAAAAMLAASVNYPLRGAVAWKSTVGTNVASDALANLASGGVTGGALIIVGEDYGDGSSIMQERTHAFAMKSQIWLLDPRPNLPSIVKAVEHGFELSEASNTPVMLELRIRACHVHGRFQTQANRSPEFTIDDALANPVRDTNRIVLPPASFQHEHEKVNTRWPAAVNYIKEHRLNETFPGEYGEIGLILQGGLYNTVVRGLERLGLADTFGNSRIPLHVLNVTYPLVDDELEAFCADKRAVLMIEEGQPDYLEQALASILRRADIATRIHGKDVLPKAGEYIGQVMLKGLRDFLTAAAPERLPPPEALPALDNPVPALPPRPPGFCTGCPERPIFTAMKLVERELGPRHVSCDIGCHLFSILPPFNIGNTTMGYGLGASAASAFHGSKGGRAISVMGDGGFWHNGLTNGVANAVYNGDDDVLLIVDNFYSAATGGQDLPSSRAENPMRHTNIPIEQAVKGVGVKWIRVVDHTYDVQRMKDTLTEALTTKEKGPKVIIAQSECMLNLQRREKPKVRQALKDGKRTVRRRFGVDSDTCTGDHACIRISGCPSLSISPNPDPLREHPVAQVDNTCVGCGLCGEAAHAAVLCPSFYRADVISHPNRWDRLLHRGRQAVIQRLQAWREKRLAPLPPSAHLTGEPHA
ncbi:thiamine pyrophosphate-dependent enzyme [Halomonas sp. BC04]|uniref:thiamine pyrophosphate-dependent enzyme n=1 Tax=Halomonas sp. BC04 TaxID=1403540 RepID=UPI0003ED7301|nr:indolepyruvate ferredoxin oxidoreductase subunit alpha [Halomonas sp. BC04]EWH02980.1 indolepyruvate ferredoxin subunit alpha [Halomonas sp. BC04]